MLVEFNVFAGAYIKLFTNAQFRVRCYLPGRNPHFDDCVIQAVASRLDFPFTGDDCPLRLGEATNLFLLASYSLPGSPDPQPVKVRALVKAIPEASQYIIEQSTIAFVGCSFIDRSCPSEEYPYPWLLSATVEGADTLAGTFILKAPYSKCQIAVGIDQNGGPISVCGNATIIQRTRKGSIPPTYFICPDMKIEIPTGTPPAAGAAGAESSANGAVFKFDDTVAGKCVAECHAAGLRNLPAEVSPLVWRALEWELPDVGSVGPGNGVASAGGKVMTFTYASMPAHNSVFDGVNNQTLGFTNITLRFKERHEWSWRQPVQYRFKRTGTSAAAATLAAGTLTSDHVIAGNPNWYTYWQLVANGFGFGPQASSMVYSSSNVGPKGECGSYVSTKYSRYEDKITIYDVNKRAIVEAISTVHHENGHRNSRQLPPDQGGFGTGIAWSYPSDRDVDVINDLWETSAAGSALGFTTNIASASMEEEWRGNWDHGWATAATVTNPPASPYCNPYPGGYSETSGHGLCPRNEYLVTNSVTAAAIRSQDWSFCPSP